MKLLSVSFIGLLRIVQSTFNKKSSVYTDNLENKLRFGVFFESMAAVFSLLYLLFTGTDGNVLKTVVCAVITGIGFLAELMTALAALRQAPLLLCTMCSFGGGIVLPSVMSIFFFDEPMSLFQWVGVVLFFVSAWLVSPKENEKSKASYNIAKALPILITNFLINGFISLVGKYYAVRVENGNAPMYSCFSYATAALMFGAVLLVLSLKNSAKEKEVLPKKAYGYGVALGLTCATIVCVSTVLSRIIPIVVLSTIPNIICIIGCLFVGRWLFKEKITLTGILGAVVGIAATVLLITGL